jgi:sortase (surface protein transpeptidase)
LYFVFKKLKMAGMTEAEAKAQRKLEKKLKKQKRKEASSKEKQEDCAAGSVVAPEIGVTKEKKDKKQETCS